MISLLPRFETLRQLKGASNFRKRLGKISERKITMVFHDLEKGRHNSGDWLEFHQSFPSPLCIHHTPQRIIQYPPPHLSLGFSKYSTVDFKF